MGLTVARAVKRAALAAGLEPDRFSGHSLRLGFVTTAAQRGCSERSIANQTGHRSVVVLRGYIRRARAFEEKCSFGRPLERGLGPRKNHVATIQSRWVDKCGPPGVDHLMGRGTTWLPTS